MDDQHAGGSGSPVAGRGGPAAVAIAAVVELVDIPALRRLHSVWTRRLRSRYGRAARADFVAAIAALLGVLVFDTLPGLFIGIGVSLLLPALPRLAVFPPVLEAVAAVR